jgi:pimeloyl-ACP methyl ester carboxylesterase
MEHFSQTIMVGAGSGATNFHHDTFDVFQRAPLPGIIIFVHGVNSDGEWYQQTEQGLCAGLNDRLKRCNQHMICPTAEGGQLRPVPYLPELTADGFLNPDRSVKSFIANDNHFSPVIQFRWGYKASLEELQQYGDGIYLNEKNYWGGGPFANGCSALPDLWNAGLSDSLFLWLHIEHLNPTNDNNVYACPPRPYFVLAALRLARLVKSLREQQADVPITIVCHSQGNMIGMAAAFFGDRMAPVMDIGGASGRCVADSYVLCNAPFSLKESNFTEDWISHHMHDKHGNFGRQTGAARSGTLRAFFDIIRQPACTAPDDAAVDRWMANHAHGFTAGDDRQWHGYGPTRSTRNRVTQYCNPHDKVISATAVQGMGWRGLSQPEIDAANGAGVFCQRVFAQGFEVGVQGKYHYWTNHYGQPQPGADAYWVPASQTARYSLGKGLAAQRGNIFGQVLTVLTAPIAIVGAALTGVRINAVPDRNWWIPLTAPPLPPFKPQALRFGVYSDAFDQGYNPRGQSRNAQHAQPAPVAGQPYAGDRAITAPHGIARVSSDAALGDADSDATMRYEDHARLRMLARREGLVAKGEAVTEEDNPRMAGADYTAWREEKIKRYLADNIDTHATDHSTIMTNPDHAQKALAYDVALGVCHIADKELRKLRIAADWALAEGVDEDSPHRCFEEYFEWGLFTGISTYEWAKASGSEGNMPEKIVDERERKFTPTPHRSGHP